MPASSTLRYLLLAATFIFSLSASRAEEPLAIDGAGASFPQPLYVRWFEQYAEVDSSMQINYRGVGSRGGRKMILEGEVDFGASDVPLVEGTATVAPERIWHVPTVASAVAIAYNLEDCPDLRLDGPTLAGIFLGKIARWNDPAIAAQNPGAKLPERKIVPVHLTEGGTLTDIFSSYLKVVSAEWRGKFAAPGAIEWPAGIGGFGNVGAAKVLSQTPGGIGYLELSVARRTGMGLAALKNAAGNYLAPTLDSVSAALSSAEIPDDFRFAVIDPPGQQAYPIGIVTWLLLNPEAIDPVKGPKLVKFLHWAYSDGEKLAPALGYVPLPKSVTDRVVARLNSLHF